MATELVCDRARALIKTLWGTRGASIRHSLRRQSRTHLPSGADLLIIVIYVRKSFTGKTKGETDI